MCRSFGSLDSLSLEEVEDPTAKAGEVVVDIYACAITFPLLLMVENKYQVKAELPFCPGGEIAGVVSAIGTGVTDISTGERVLVEAQFGGLAEKIAVPREHVIRLPANVNLTAASGFLYAYGTAWHGLKKCARIQAGESLLVLGAAGSVGLAVIELGASMGARIIAAASTDEKLALCRERGAVETINYEREDLRARLRELGGDKGVDVVFDLVGTQYSEPALRSMAWGGRFLVVGFAGGEIPRLPLNILLLKGSSMIGVWLGEYKRREPARYWRDVDELVTMLADGKIRPYVSSTYPLERTVEELQEVAGRRARGKVAVVPRSDEVAPIIS